MLLKPEDRAVNIDIDLATIGEGVDSLEDNIVSIVLIQQLARATVDTADALATVQAQHTVDYVELEEKIEKVLNDIQDIYTDVLAGLIQEAEQVVDSSYLTDRDTGDKYTYSFTRKKGHPVLILTKVEAQPGEEDE